MNNNRKLSAEDVNRTIAQLRQDIVVTFKCRKLNRAFRMIDYYAVLNQTVNVFFRDETIESILREIGENEIGISTRSPEQSKKIVFYDQIGTTICLGLQYLRGLIANGYQVLYIFESPMRKIKADLLEEVKNTCDEVLIFEEESSVALARRIQLEIERYGAPKLVCHCSADGAMASSLFYSMPNVEKYRIVPGDHHFYIGLDCIDHFFEYRKFAIKVAVEERKIPLDKIYKLPYYPILESYSDFLGFPEEAEGKIVILAAGSEYKFHGSSWFFDISEWILKNHENVVIVFLGGKSAKILRFIDEKGLRGRFLTVGYRKDFVECMKHSDMFLNSYPMGGGLVGLTAINLSIPVISHYDQYNGLQNSIRSFLGAEDIDSPISFKDDDQLKQYVDRLVRDPNFRVMEGARMKSMAQTQSKFDEMLGGYLNGELSSVKEVTTQSCHLDKRAESYLELQNSFSPTVLYLLIKIYGVSFLFKFPYLRGFAYSRRRIVSGWLLGNLAEKCLPSGAYSGVKAFFKKLFV